MTGYPERYIVFDTESRGELVDGDVPTEELTLRLGVALVVDGRGGKGRKRWWFEFTVHEQFHEMIGKLPFTTTPIYVFAHNIGFDVRQVAWMWWVGQGRYSLTPPTTLGGSTAFKSPLFIADSPPFIVRLFRPDGQQIVLIDTYQWLTTSLAKIGGWIGESKGKMPDPDDPDDRWFSYCRQDVKVLELALQRLWGFLKAHRVANWAYTPASQSMMLYRMRYEQRRITRTEDISLLALDRAGYFGGLVEAFRVGNLPGLVHQIDINSLYPYVMQARSFPCEITGHGDFSRETSLPAGFDPSCSTAEVWLETPDHPFPCRGKEQTCWVIGNVHTVLCGPELERAWQLGLVRRVGEWVTYRLDDLFGRWVRYWWGVRSESRWRNDDLSDHVCKSLLNSLHGKFGQRTGEWIPVGPKGNPNDYGAGVYCTMEPGKNAYWRVIGGQEFHRDSEEEDERGFVPIAAWTSSAARVFMWDMMDIAGPENVFHVATDSLLVNGIGLGNLQVAGRVKERILGLFRHDDSQENVVIHSPNVIDWGEKKKRPGIKRGSEELAPNVWTIREWSGFAADTLAGRFGSVTIETVVRRLDRRYRRRVVLPDGSTRPYRIDNWAMTLEEQSRAPIGRDWVREVT